LEKIETRQGWLWYEGATEKFADDCGIRDFGSVLMIDRLVIKPRCRGRGHGTKLLNNVISLAREQGYKYIVLMAWPVDSHGAPLKDYEDDFASMQNRLFAYYRGFGFRLVRWIESGYMKMRL